MYSGLTQATSGGGGMVTGACTSMSMMRPVEVSMGSPVRLSLPGEQQQQQMMMSGGGGYAEGHNPTTTMMENRMMADQGDQFVEHGGMMAPIAQIQTHQQQPMSVPGGGTMHEIREQDLLMPPVRF